MGKGSNSPPPSAPVTQSAPEVDLSPMYMALSQMQLSNSASQQQGLQQMQAMQDSAPKQSATPSEQSWKERADALRARISASETDAASKRRGRESTILTSPLTDEEVKTTEPILKGS